MSPRALGATNHLPSGERAEPGEGGALFVPGSSTLPATSTEKPSALTPSGVGAGHSKRTLHAPGRGESRLVASGGNGAFCGPVTLSPSSDESQAQSEPTSFVPLAFATSSGQLTGVLTGSAPASSSAEIGSAASDASVAPSRDTRTRPASV